MGTQPWSSQNKKPKGKKKAAPKGKKKPQTFAAKMGAQMMGAGC